MSGITQNKAVEMPSFPTTIAKGSRATDRARTFFGGLWQALQTHPALQDINAQHAVPLGYNRLDLIAARTLWANASLLAAWLVVSLYLPYTVSSVQSWWDLGWPTVSACLIVGALALAIPLLTHNRMENHFVWRLGMTWAFATYSFLFLILTGWSGALYFHAALTIIFLAMYADWRIEWIAAGLYGFGFLVLAVISPEMIRSMGMNGWPMLFLFLFLLGLAYLGDTYCRNYRKSLDELVESMQRNDQFLAVASHELRTPLTSMKGYTEVLQRRLKRSSQDDLLGYADKLDDQLSRMTGMVRDLLDASRIQSGQLTMRSERLSANGLVANAVEEVQGLAYHHKIVVSGWLNKAIIGDAMRLHQVLINLLSNAMKYSPTADKVKVILSEDAGGAVISIQDFGMGIPLNEQAHIFEPYFRSQNALREDVPGGLGMGLYISAEIVERHGGRIWVESREGRGSTFSIWLPFALGGAALEEDEGEVDG